MSMTTDNVLHQRAKQLHADLMALAPQVKLPIGRDHAAAAVFNSLLAEAKVLHPDITVAESAAGEELANVALRAGQLLASLPQPKAKTTAG